jgi:hypothetical protein
MDDASWEFLCNNSPKLVKKNRPKTPNFYTEASSEALIPKLLPNTLSKPKLLQKPLSIVKGSFKYIYRDATPKTGIVKSSSRIIIKPVKDIISLPLKDNTRKNISPLRPYKTSGITMKKLTLKLSK